MKVRDREITLMKDLSDQMYHQPVMLNQVIEGLRCCPGKVYIDGTVGGAGHSQEIAKLIQPDGTLICLDVDNDALDQAFGKLKDFNNIHIEKSNYLYIPEIMEKLKMDKVNGGILLDLGVSYNQLTSPDKGFSFQNDSILDMRMDRQLSITAEDLVNDLSEVELAKIFKEYGEEKFSNRIARAISIYSKQNKIKTTRQLAKIIEQSVPRLKYTRIHPATRVFQALRIKVNNELEILKQSLDKLLDVTEPGSRIVVITFHSLEDRIVKQFFKFWSVDCVCAPELIECRCNHTKKLKIINKKPIVPEEDELKVNNAARSAKLRIVERL